MKELKLILLFLIPVVFYGQQMTYEEWEKEALTNKRLLPKYGNLPKSEDELTADNEFLMAAIKIDTTAEKASGHMIELGFKYLYKDIKIAMYRFNQAYLLDNTNSDIYWGYGAVYFMFNRLDLAREQYKKGIEVDPENTRILTDYGTTFMSEYSTTQEIYALEKAISIMSKSYIKDSTNQNTSYKLASCFLMKNDCESAKKYYKACMQYGGDPVTEEFKAEINKRCK